MNQALSKSFHAQSCRVVVNPSGLWSPGQRFESAQDYKNIFNSYNQYYFSKYTYDQNEPQPLCPVNCKSCPIVGMMESFIL